MNKLIVSAAVLCAFSMVSGAADGVDSGRKAEELYANGMYARALTVLGNESGELSDAYRAMCLLKLDMKDALEYADAFLAEYPHSRLSQEIRVLTAGKSFSQERYSDALKAYSCVDIPSLNPELAQECMFNMAYCSMRLDDSAGALDGFKSIIGLPSSKYRVPSEYYSGYLLYLANKPAEAMEHFRVSVTDGRFAELSEYYLLECNFLLKNYDYVIDRGSAVAASSPESRKAQIFRMLSESYMVRGDARKAKEYFDMENVRGRNMSRSDYFHAGSVLFGINDYDGAVKNFLNMQERTDSIGQIANYQLGYAYVKKGNMVAALEAFNDAARYSFNPVLEEDAAFNYAKLAFDVNHDPSGFKAYLKRFSTTRKGDVIYGYMALADLFEKDYASAIDYYGKMDTLDDEQKINYLKANYIRASQLIAAGSWTDAEPYLKAAGFYLPKTDPLNQMSRYQLAEVYYRTGKYRDAAKLYTELYNSSALYGQKEHHLLSYNVAYSYFKDGEFVQAAKWFDIYMGTGESEALKDAAFRRADCDFYRKDYRSAVDTYQKAYEVSGEIFPLYAKALCQGLLGEKKKKVQTLLPVENMNPEMENYEMALYELGRALMDTGDNSGAVRVFTTLTRNGRDKAFCAKGGIGLGMALRNRAEYDKALDCYKAVVSEMPGSEYAQDALLAIESIYQAKKHPELYLEYLESLNIETGKTDSEKEQVYFNTAEQVFLAGNYAQAEVSLQKYLDTYPEGSKRGEALFYQAESKRLRGEREQSLPLYSAAIDALPDGSFKELAREKTASINYSLERYEEAYKAYSELSETAVLDQFKESARKGMMLSAFKSKNFEAAVSASESFDTDEALSIKARSLMGLSRRNEALGIFRKLAANPSTEYGADAMVALVKNSYDSGDFDNVQKMVFDFMKTCGSQSYYLAKAYIILGDSFVRQENYAQAKVTYESIRKGYKGTDDIVETVDARLEALADLMKK